MANDAADELAAPPGVLGNAAFWPFWFGVRTAAQVAFRLRVEGAPPPSGPCVLAANHGSYLDPIVMGAAMRRRIAFLMTEVVWRKPAMQWFYRWNRAIPVATRGGNREALRAARAVLQQGRVVGIFPEGGMSRDGLPLLGNPGAMSLVLDDGVPIVPVGIVGANVALPPGAKWPRPRRIVVRFGEPITSAQIEALAANDRRTRLFASTRLVMDRIAALLGETSREAVLAAQPSSRRR